VNREPSLLEAARMVVRRRLLIFALAGAGCALAWAASWLATPRYRAEVTILPVQAAGGTSLLGQLAGATDLPLDFRNRPEDLFGAILRSSVLLDAALGGGRSGEDLAEQLAAALGHELADDPTARRELRERLRRDLLDFSRDRASGVMTLRLEVPRDPALAAALANALADALDAFVTARHESRGRTRRDFTQARLAEIEGELQQSRAALAEFVASNRAFADSPELRQRHDELTSEVQALFAVWIEVRRQLEMARIEMHGDLAAIEILDRAEIPWRRSAPRRGLWAAFGLLAGALVGMAVASWRDAVRS
jgi:uncharacterized protein involved in exopolysaccharide biosynthesis